MKILLFYQYFGTPKGSWSTRAYELTKRWVTEGHEVTVVTAPYDKSDIRPDGFITRKEIEGIKLIVVNSGDSNKLSISTRAFRAIRFALVSSFYAIFQSYDVLISSSGPITVGLPMILAKTLRSKPTVFEVRDLWPSGGIELGLIKTGWQSRLALWFEALCYKKANLIIPCSIGMEASINKRFPNKSTLVVPNASDPEVFQISPTVPIHMPSVIGDNKIFLYAGSLGLMDDCSQIISAMGELRNEAISLVLVGDGAEREKLEEQAVMTGNPNIHFMGLVPKTEVAKWFSIATASFVTFKDFEVLHTSSPNKMFDTFAAGVPVIQSTKGWIKDLVDTEHCGINVSSDQPKEFADAMILLSKNHTLHKEMSANALRLAETDFNRDNLSHEYLASLIALNHLNRSQKRRN
ncbi:glycosyltransferase family 4 protein [Roseivirga sp. E12]|uniref:glycosyltransferase family 4 protein n=1 Tax=Roseivirga sp. E12 TaxID=2819237 RepID=UPI001ABD370E|nr:glycosyltransferase family 4 protein [Roseivirga sp. E12]MBO3699070.1 glycosyltransferase family 4 protein [Roseivirga sp. E12]